MKPNKKKKIIIISIIVVVLLLIMGIVYAFVGTDLMKSNKDLFFKYASQIFDEQNGFLDARMQQYEEKKKQNVYENYGNFNVNITSQNLDEDTIDNVNNVNISFEGNTDNINDRAEELIKINYSDDVNFSMLYKKIENLYGLKLNEVAKQFLVVDKEKLDSLFEKLEIDGMEPVIQSLTSTDESIIDFSEEEKNVLKEKYLPEIQNSLDESSFTKVTTEKTQGYALEISNQTIKEIIIKILNVLKDDEIMLNKLNNILGIQLQQQDIDGLVNSLDSLEVEDGNVIITIHQSNNKLSKIEIQINDQLKIEISKTTTDDELSYNMQLTIYAEDQNININLSSNYSGLQKLEDIMENYQINITYGNEENNGIEYNIENEVKFLDTIEIADIPKDNEVVLTSLKKDNLDNIIELVTNKIVEVNQEKMDKLGIKGDNPLMYMIPGLGQSLMLYNSSINMLDGEFVENETINQANEKNNETSKNEQNNLEESEKEVFNETFLVYEGENIRGTDVKRLVQLVIANNMAEEEKQIEITGDLKVINEELPDNIQTTQNYKVSCKYDDDGYINEIEITEQE